MSAPEAATDPSPSRLRAAIERARQRDGIALMPFLAAGYPDLATTAACVRALDAAGAGLIEIGFPFSDPIADGPAIREAFTEALSRGVRVADVFAMAESVAGSVAVPLVAMISYSIVFRYGVARFARDAKAVGFAGLIVPDLPPPEAQGVCDLVRGAGLDTVLLVAPTTPASRRAEIARLCSGFVYYLSVAGTTGERDQLPEDLESNLRELKRVSQVPVCVGFGIHRREHVRQLEGLADGAIVGTAFVRRVKERAGDGADKIASHVADYCRALLAKDR